MNKADKVKVAGEIACRSVTSFTVGKYGTDPLYAQGRALPFARRHQVLPMEWKPLWIQSKKTLL
jgi:hypothetical protein